MNRLEQLRTYMEEQGLDAFYVAKPANVRWIPIFLLQKESSSLSQIQDIRSRLLTNVRSMRS